jgi:hypothetical protein
MTRELRVVGDAARIDVARCAGATRLDTLEDVLHWGGHVVDVVVQDEFTHDVIAVIGSGGGFLVFDTT